MSDPIDRRSFLRLAGIGFGATVLGSCGSGGELSPGTRGVARSAAGLEAAPVEQRSLIVVEMAGGNDGLSTVVPLADPAYRRLRPQLAIAPGDALAIDDEVGLHPMLPKLHAHGVTTVEGVGSPTPDLSHFAMAERWYQGDTEGTAAPSTGFLGRICDAIDEGAPVTGVSLGGGSGRLLLADRAGTITLPGIDGTWFLSADNDDRRGLRKGLEAFGSSDLGGRAGEVASGTSHALDFADLVNGLPDQESEAENDLGWKLLLASHLIGADVGVRVVHVSMDGDFDTHEGHRGTHDQLMESFDLALDGFHRHLADAGMDDQVLVATMSEFGRRPEENDSAGLDHGTASTMLLAGPIAPGRHGEPPSLTDLDADGNLLAPVTLGSYQATLAEWLGAPASDASVDGSEPLPGLLP